jgi:hypothetical protein
MPASHGRRKLQRDDKFKTTLTDGKMRLSGSVNETYGHLTERRFADGTWSVMYHLADKTFVGEAQGETMAKAEEALLAKYPEIQWKT